jgi:membrane-associated phospholipid phosphatase
MRTSAARFISIAGHPFVLLPLLVFLPRFSSGTGGAFRTTFAFAAIVLGPMAALIWRSVTSGEWHTVDASNKADRPLLYKASMTILAAATAYFYFVDHSPEIARGCAIAAGMLLLAAMLNRWCKISLHITFACFCGILLARVRLGYGIPILLLVPPLIWSRLVLSRHVFSEAIGGAMLGLAGAACFMWLPNLARPEKARAAKATAVLAAAADRPRHSLLTVPDELRANAVQSMLPCATN